MIRENKKKDKPHKIFFPA